MARIENWDEAAPRLAALLDEARTLLPPDWQVSLVAQSQEDPTAAVRLGQLNEIEITRAMTLIARHRGEDGKVHAQDGYVPTNDGAAP